MEELIEWSVLQDAQWRLHIAKTKQGLCYVGSPGAGYEEMAAHIQKRFPFARFYENAEELQPFIYELLEYLDGTRISLSLPVDIKGTPFQEDVWQALRQIPYGNTVSYSDVAASISRPSAARAVGTAIGANPVLIAVPCHRVLGKSGAISGYRGGLNLKRFLLGIETNNAGSSQ